MPDTTNIFEQKPDQDTFGGRFSRARDASGLSTKDLAWRLGVKVSTIKAWETDRSQPGSHRLTTLSGLLGVSLAWLIHGVGLGPIDSNDEADEAAAEVLVDEQFAKLKLLHIETGQLLGRIESDMGRRASEPAI